MSLFPRNTNRTGAHPFDFETLWQWALAINSTNPHNTSIYHPYDNQSRLTLSRTACEAFAGSDATWYPRQDVYDRVILWRVPLIALVATTTLPALGYWTQVFTIVHLISDPIDALWSLFYKLDYAQRCARWATGNDSDKSGDQQGSGWLLTFSRHQAAPPHINGGGPSSSAQALAMMPTPLSRRETAITALASEAEDESERNIENLLVQRDKKIIRYYQDVFSSIVYAYQERHEGNTAKEAIISAS